jgi:hypothetical protein
MIPEKAFSTMLGVMSVGSVLSNLVLSLEHTQSS